MWTKQAWSTQDLLHGMKNIIVLGDTAGNMAANLRSGVLVFCFFFFCREKNEGTPDRRLHNRIFPARAANYRDSLILKAADVVQFEEDSLTTGADYISAPYSVPLYLGFESKFLCF